MASDKDTIEDIKGVFELCQDAWSEHHTHYIDEYRFNRVSGYQWPEKTRKDRERAKRPCLEVNKLIAVIKQIVNDTRQNKPSIKVRPADSGGDPETAEVYSGLIRNIETISGADAAYDTAVDCAASGGFGFFRVKLDYAHDDSFDLDILIDRISNPLSVYGDPMSTAVDSSDWNHAFVTDLYSEEAFKDRWPDAEPVSWSGERNRAPNGEHPDQIMVAEYWCREDKPKTIVKLSDGKVMGEAEYAVQKDMFDALGVGVVGSRQIKGKAVYQKIMTGAEILERVDWPGIWIPIIPVYGDELNEEGERRFLSATHYAKDAQRRYNYWTTTSTELVALAPRVPFIGPEIAFQGEDNAKWATINTENHQYVSYKGSVAPQRQPLYSGPAAGAMQEALIAADEIKATTGLYDASLGARSNETSGIAIERRKLEGDTATFHFTDNLSRAIRHCGRILIDLIPKIYKGERIVRVLGEDGNAQNVRLGPRQEGEPGQPGMPPVFNGVYDLSAGKYDLVVDTGPSYSTRRVETAQQITEFLRAYPDAAPIIGDILVKNLDWKDADLIADRLRAMLPGNLAGEQAIPAEVQEQIEQGKVLIRQLQEELAKEKGANLKGAADIEKARLEKEKIALERDRLPIEEMQARASLLQKQKELTVTQAQGEAVTSEAKANAGAMTEFATAAAQMNQAMQGMMQALADLQLKVSAPRVKRGRAVKQPDGTWAMETVEAA